MQVSIHEFCGQKQIAFHQRTPPATVFFRHQNSVVSSPSPVSSSSSSSAGTQYAYVLITPAKNEEKLIGETIASVTAQSILPAQWVIVSDGSTDRTDDIVRAACARHSWIKLVPLPQRQGRNFAAVVHATEAGIAALEVKDYHFIGLLDSDLRFQPDYFAGVLAAFEANPKLGLAGGVAIDIGRSKSRLPRNRHDVPGALQFFRRECFQSLGGLVAIPEGGWDALTCARARMNGYETELLTHLIVDHLKPRNVGEGGIFRRKWQMGVRDYALGYGFTFEFVKCVGRWYEKPLLLGAFCWWLGYCGALLKRKPRLLPPDLLAFVRREQMHRLRKTFGLG